jgi:hypothetical protein
MDQLTHQEGDRHVGHKMAEAHASHDRHAGHSVAMFREQVLVKFRSLDSRDRLVV